MEQKRLPFRFRIPWISEASASCPAAESSSRRPKKQPKSPFRPPGVGPAQPQQHSPSRPPRPPTTSSLSTESPAPLISQTSQSPSRDAADETARTSSSISQQQKQNMVMPMSKQSQQIKVPSKTIPPDTSSKPQKTSAQHTGEPENKTKSATALNTPTNTEKLETHTESSKTHREEQSKFQQAEEMGKVVHNPKVGKAQDSETVERKIMFATSNPTGKDIRVVSSIDPTVRNVSSISSQKPLLPNVDKAPLHKEIREDISNCAHKLASGHLAHHMDENPVSVTTLAGDNRGATMHIGSKLGKKERSIYIHRAYRKNPEKRPEVTTDGEESSDEEASDNSVKKDEAGNAYVNSNIQSLNNSLMCQSSINDRDPGVHLTLPQKHIESIKCYDKRAPENRKPDFSVSRNDGLRIRRRCLRGLFAEPSDSDPDNPNKPQRHGCKYKCGSI